MYYFVAASVHVCDRFVYDVPFAVLSDGLIASRLSSSIRSPMNFNRRCPEEFQCKIFLGKDLHPILLAVLSFAWEIVRNSPMVNIVSQNHISLSWSGVGAARKVSPDWSQRTMTNTGRAEKPLIG